MKRPDDIAPHMRWTALDAAREALCTGKCDKWLDARAWDSLYSEQGSALGASSWSRASNAEGQSVIAFAQGADEWLVIGREAA